MLFCSPRSQCASTGSKDGSRLMILGGYNYDDPEHSLHSGQLVSSDDSLKEFRLPFHCRLSSAVTLSSGLVIVTGGMGCRTNVWSGIFSDQPKFAKRNDMPVGRMGHSSVAFFKGRLFMIRSLEK